MLIGSLLSRYLDPEAVRVVQGGKEQMQALLAQRWDAIVYTGGAVVGRIVAAAAAVHLTPTLLELGGKNPALVAADADMDLTARRLLCGKLLNCGQLCL